MGVWNDVEVKCQLSATPVSNPTYPDTLSGDLAVLFFNLGDPAVQYLNVDGAYKGIQRQVNSKRKQATELVISVLDGTASKKYVGTGGQYLYIQVKTYDDDGTTLLNTEKGTLQLSRGGRVYSNTAPTRIEMAGVVTAYAKT